MDLGVSVMQAENVKLIQAMWVITALVPMVMVQERAKHHAIVILQKMACVAQTLIVASSILLLL
jgi:hypothetical protein